MVCIPVHNGKTLSELERAKLKLPKQSFKRVTIAALKKQHDDCLLKSDEYCVKKSLSFKKSDHYRLKISDDYCLKKASTRSVLTKVTISLGRTNQLGPLG